MRQGFIINMFRGDPALLGNAMGQLEDRCGVPTLGVLPYLPGLVLDAEDSLHRMLAAHRAGAPATAAEVLDVVVLRLPRLSNFTDFDPLLIERDVAVRFVDHPSTLGDPDLIVLPGTKSTTADLAWLGASGLRDVVMARHRASSPPTILGICGGFQMLGHTIEDPDGVESAVPVGAGLGLVAPGHTVRRPRRSPGCGRGTGEAGSRCAGYEIRHGRTRPLAGWREWLTLDDRSAGGDQVESACDQPGRVYRDIAARPLRRGPLPGGVPQRRGQRPWKDMARSGRSFAAARERQIDRVADACAAHLDTDALWRLLEGSPSREPGPLSVRAGAPCDGRGGSGGPCAPRSDRRVSWSTARR